MPAQYTENQEGGKSQRHLGVIEKKFPELRTSDRSVAQA
jgi:hypothetical protein